MRGEVLLGWELDRNSADGWKSVDLPHTWSGELDGFFGEAWYRFDFAVNSKATGTWCLLLPRLNMNAAAYVNGVLVGDGGSLVEPLSRNWHRPLLFCFPALLLRQGDNRLEIDLRAFANRFGQLQEIRLGPKPVVAAEHARLQLRDQTVYEISSWLSFILAALIGFLWWKRRRPAWFWFALTSFFWGLTGLNLLVVDAPVPSRQWEFFSHAIIGFVPICMLFFLHRMQGLKPAGIERLVLGASALLVSLLALAPLEHFFVMSDVWHGFSLLVGAYAVWGLFSRYRARNSREYLIILVSIGIIFLFGLHDMLVQVGFLAAGSTFLLSFSIPALLLVISALLINKFVAAEREAEDLSRTLEQRVRHAEREIESNYKQIIELETAQAINDEKTRIMRDLHDDLGGKLLTMVYRANEDGLRDLARATLEDMRELVRAGQAASAPLSDVLADLRGMAVRQVEQFGLKFDWQARGCGDEFISGEQFLHVRRILGEAVVNALKHAQARTIAVDIACANGAVTMQVSDDGRGLPEAQTDANGMLSIEKRAKRLGGEIRWLRNEKGGCTVWLRWNLKS